MEGSNPIPDIAIPENERPAEVRFYQPGDEPGMLTLLRSAFGAWPTLETSVDAIDYLRWKLGSDPLALQHHVVAEIDSRIVGMRCCLVQRFAVRGQTILARQGVDVCVAPELRGRGIHSGVLRYAAAWSDPYFDIAIGNTTRKSLAEMESAQGGRWFANPIRRLVCETAHDVTPNRAIVDATRFGDEIDALWREAAPQFEFIGLRTASYLNWRYGDPRSGKFTVRQLWEGGRLAGYAVRHDSYGESYLVELLTLPGRPDVVAALIEDALAGCARAGFDRLFCDISAIHPYRAVLLKRGFVEKGRIMPFTVRAMRPADLDVSFISDPNARVHLMLGDTDLV